MTIPKLAEIADRINAHLKRMEAEQGRPMKMEDTRFFQAVAYPAGSKVGVSYISFQGASMLTKAEALAYLEWLDAGNAGKHYLVPKVPA